jgi:hypothetical protein
MKGLDGLFQRDAAPLQCWSAPAPDCEALLAEARTLPGTRVVDLDGGALPDGDSLFRALAVPLAFPGYFGANWDALDECLNDLEWLTETGVLLVIRRAGRLLEGEPEGLAAFLAILGGAARELEEPKMGEVCLRRIPIQLRILLHTETEAERIALDRRLVACGRILPAFHG